MSTLTLPFAALGALLAALLETSVAPELLIGGAQVDLVLCFAVVAAMRMGLQDGLVWAFLGGLMLDMLIPGRPIGATTLSLLLVVGVAALAVRLPGPRRTVALIAVFVMTWLFHGLLLGVMTLTEGVALSGFRPTVVLFAAIINAVIAVPAVLLFATIERRFGATERADW
jgi:rod shape-determining protein MreD